VNVHPRSVRLAALLVALDLDATCGIEFHVPGGRSIMHVRVTFEPENCGVSTSMEQVQ
jgi:hypothetical protein